MNIISKIEKEYLGKKMPKFNSGDKVRVHYKIKEGDKERVQAFEGIVIGKKKGGVNSSFTVRKISYGVGVERIFPLFSPKIQKIEILSQGDVRRAKLYYLRKLEGKKAKVKTKEFKRGAKETEEIVEPTVTPEVEVKEEVEEEIKKEEKKESKKEETQEKPE